MYIYVYWDDSQDLIIFPGDAEFKRVPQCKTGRVFILKFKDSIRKYFYWMQEPSEEKDEDLMKKVMCLSASHTNTHCTRTRTHTLVHDCVCVCVLTSQC